MLERGWGRIVNVGPRLGPAAGPRNLAYGASKAAELSLSRGYAEHYAARGILVNAVNPGPIEGELWLGPGRPRRSSGGRGRRQPRAGARAG